MKEITRRVLHDQLKESTRELHVSAHAVPYIKGLLDNNIPLISYIGYLRALAIIHGTLENQLKNISHEILSDVVSGYIPRLPLILSDLDHLKASEVKDIIPAVQKALMAADKIIMYSALNPLRLIGFIYVLEGARNGGHVLKKHLVQTFNLEADLGTSHLSPDNDFKSFWDSFIHKTDVMIPGDNHRLEIINSAVEMFNYLIGIYESLMPVDENNLGNHITSLNPEAGNYPITTDPAEIAAAIKSGKTCWSMFPYYEHRYGERGRRFTSSDAVWLVSVSELPQNMATEQVKWLARYLAIRGMPTFTMEMQMRLHYSILSENLPENESRYRKFLTAADEIKAMRNKYMTDSLFEESNDIFENNLNALNGSVNSDSLPVKNTGFLIASSLTDAKNNIPDSVTSLNTWLTDRGRFSEEWITAVMKTYSWLEIEMK